MLNVYFFQGEFVSCLLALLRHMKDRHYQQLLQRFTSKDDLRVSQLSTLSDWHQFFILTKKHVKHPLLLSLRTFSCISSLCFGSS